MKRFLLLTVFIFLGIAIAGIWHYTHKKPEKIATPVIVPSVKIIKTETPKQKTEKKVVNSPKIKISEEKGKKKVIETKKPEWMKGLLALHQKYYPGWKEAGTGSSQTGFSTPSQSRYQKPTAYSRSSPSSSGSSRTARSSPPSRVSSTGSIPAQSTSPTSQNDSSGSGGGTSQPDSSSPDNGENNGGDNGDGNEPPQQNPVSVIRSINGKNVTLTITVNEQTSGLIITESIPSSYQISSSSPNYSKKRENTYKWLFYGKNIDSQSINYTLEGTGGGTISGNYKSSKGSGNITGYSQL